MKCWVVERCLLHIIENLKAAYMRTDKTDINVIPNLCQGLLFDTHIKPEVFLGWQVYVVSVTGRKFFSLIFFQIVFPNSQNNFSANLIGNTADLILKIQYALRLVDFLKFDKQLQD